MQTKSGQERQLTRQILFRELPPAPPAVVERYFGPSRFPGTTAIGYRRTHPEIFQDTLDSRLESYEEWLTAQVARMVESIRAAGIGGAIGQAIKDWPDHRLAERFDFWLDYRTDSGDLLADAIPQQMYEDVFIRMILSITRVKTGTGEPHLYRNFNALCHRIGMALLTVIDKKYGTGRADADNRIDGIIRVSVLSGHIGINLKSSASAASALLNRNRIPLPDHWVSTPDAVHGISDADLIALACRVLEMADGPEGRFGLTAMAKYHLEVINTANPTLLIFFCDDYLESIIDLKRFEIMLADNPSLSVLFVPRAGRYGNDLAFSDMGPILREPHFVKLRTLETEGRFYISPHGPRAGCIDIRDMSPDFIDEIDRLGCGRQVIIETKGCRNFEMLRGSLPIPWYTSFNCNRALSIRTVGVDGPPVFLRIPPGLDAYDGFTRPVIAPSDSFPDTGVRFARMTTRDLYDAMGSSAYLAFRRQAGDEYQANSVLMGYCRQQGLTFSELVQILNGYQDGYAEKAKKQFPRFDLTSR